MEGKGFMGSSSSFGGLCKCKNEVAEKSDLTINSIVEGKEKAASTVYLQQTVRDLGSLQCDSSVKDENAFDSFALEMPHFPPRESALPKDEKGIQTETKANSLASDEPERVIPVAPRHRVDRNHVDRQRIKQIAQ